MGNISKAWDWEKNKDEFWLRPSEESYYLLERWKEKGFENFLDLGCGLGRHSIFFAKAGFSVSSMDLSEFAVDGLNAWAEREKLSVHATCSDMLKLPYEDNSFNCILAYHVLSHTDTSGIVKIISELKRVLKPGGEFYITFCSKQTWSYKKSGYPKIDENTVLKIEDGPENNIPHFYVDEKSLKELLKDFTLISVRQVQDLYVGGRNFDSWHYFVLGKK